MSWGYGFAPYVSVGEKKAQAAKKLAALQKKDPTVNPVVIEGRKIANTWWGIAWCKNLESYADYSNRIGRGSAYLKNGFVLDLKIEEGVIRGKVSGSSIYDVTIKIDKLSNACKDDIVGQIGQRISSIEDLIAGNFPKEFGEIFLKQPVYEKSQEQTEVKIGKNIIRKTTDVYTQITGGIFPSPHEIHLDCSCPDWADMCKHVAAVLYGVGARLDTDPLLFFKLRGIDVNEFIKKSVEEKMKNMLKNAGKKSSRVIANADLSRLFGV